MTIRTLLLLAATGAVACSPRPESRDSAPPPPTVTDTATMARPDTMLRTDTTLRDTSRMSPTTPAR